MAIVYVLNKDGKPLMPTNRCGHVRILLKQNNAKVVNTNPFTIRLLYDTSHIVQPLYIGIDPGRTNIGVAVVKKDGKPVFTAQVETRNKDIPKLMRERKMHRQNRRYYRRRCKRQRRANANNTNSSKRVKQETAQNGNASKKAQKIGVFERMLPGYEKPILCIGIKNKEARFNNRKRPEGWLTPTANHLLLTHINVINKICKILPITDAVLEVNKFAFMQLDNPNIKKWEYQNGLLKGYADVESAVSELQNGRCVFCNKLIEHYHHIIPRSKNGSNTINNLVGLCAEHHMLVHTNEKWENRLLSKKEGLRKKYDALGILNQIFPQLIKRLEEKYPNHLFITNGKCTAEYRKEYGVNKDHYLDAYCIACSILTKFNNNINDTKPHHIKQFRRHNRRMIHKSNINRVYYLYNKIVAINRHKSTVQTKDSLEDFALNNKELVCKLTTKKHLPQYRTINTYSNGSIFLAQNKLHIFLKTQGKHNNKPDYCIDTNSNRYTYNSCYFLINNVGFVYI